MPRRNDSRLTPALIWVLVALAAFTAWYVPLMVWHHTHQKVDVEAVQPNLVCTSGQGAFEPGRPISVGSDFDCQLGGYLECPAYHVCTLWWRAMPPATGPSSESSIVSDGVPAEYAVEGNKTYRLTAFSSAAARP